MKMKITDLMDLYEDRHDTLGADAAPDQRQSGLRGANDAPQTEREVVEVKQTKHRFGWKEGFALAAALAIVVSGAFALRALTHRTAPNQIDPPVSTEAPDPGKLPLLSVGEGWKSEAREKHFLDADAQFAVARTLLDEGVPQSLPVYTDSAVPADGTRTPAGEEALLPYAQALADLAGLPITQGEYAGETAGYLAGLGDGEATVQVTDNGYGVLILVGGRDGTRDLDGKDSEEDLCNHWIKTLFGFDPTGRLLRTRFTAFTTFGSDESVLLVPRREDPTLGLLSYSFEQTILFLSEEGRLNGVAGFRLPSAADNAEEKTVLPASLAPIGSYPVISPEEALALLRAGNYLSLAEQPPVIDGEASLQVELVYPTEGKSRTVMPFYRFWSTMELDDAQIVSLAYYVPAVRAEYLSDFEGVELPEPVPTHEPQDDLTEEVSALFADEFSLYCRALLSSYDDPLDSDLELLFYLGLPTETEQPSQEELESLKALGHATELETVGCTRLPGTEVDAALSQLFGLSRSSYVQSGRGELETLLGNSVAYLPEYDCYYSFHSDYIGGPVHVSSAMRTAGGKIAAFYERSGESWCVILRSADNGLQIVSNQPWDGSSQPQEQLSLTDSLLQQVNPLLTVFAQQYITDLSRDLDEEYELASFAHLYVKLYDRGAFRGQDAEGESWETLTLEQVNEVLSALLNKTVSPEDGTDYTALRGDNYAQHESFHDGFFWWPPADGEQYGRFALAVTAELAGGGSNASVGGQFRVYEALPEYFEEHAFTDLYTMDEAALQASLDAGVILYCADGEYLMNAEEDHRLWMETYTEWPSTEPEPPEAADDPALHAEIDALLSDPAGWYARALSSDFAAPADVDLHELFYDGIPGQGWADREELIALSGEDLSTEDGDWPGPGTDRLPRQEMDRVLRQYFGLSLEETAKRGLDSFGYLADRDCYYHCHGDTNQEPRRVEQVRLLDDGTVLFTYRSSFRNDLTEGQFPQYSTARLQPDGEGKYRILSNLPGSWITGEALGSLGKLYAGDRVLRAETTAADGTKTVRELRFQWDGLHYREGDPDSEYSRFVWGEWWVPDDHSFCCAVCETTEDGNRIGPWQSASFTCSFDGEALTLIQQTDIGFGEDPAGTALRFTVVPDGE